MTDLPRCTDRCNRMSASGLCDWCSRRLAAELAAFPGLVADLERQLTPSQSHGDGRGGGERGIGVRVDVLSALGPSGTPSVADGTLRPGTEADQVGDPPLWTVLAEWARLAAEELSHTAVRPWTFASARTFLVRQHDRICARPWADDYAAEVHQAWRTAMTLTGRWESAQPQSGRYCPWCQAGALYQRPGEDTYDCQERAGGCGRTMERVEYEQMVRMGAAYLRQSGVV